ncbi:MAG: hypothetical protein ACREM1_14040 [Longimicrobiales bacterium]
MEQRGVKLSGGQRQLVVSEYALALVLAVGAGLVMRTFANLNSEDPGFDPAGVLSLRLSTPPTSYEAADRRQFWSELLERIGALPVSRARAPSTSCRSEAATGAIS